MSKKIFAFDIDGTLLNSKHEISKGTHDALELIKANGDISVLATGRHWFTMNAIKELTGIDKAITINGSAYYDFGTAKFENPVYFKNDEVEKIITLFNKWIGDFGFALYTPNKLSFFDNAWHPMYKNTYGPNLGKEQFQIVESIDELIKVAKNGTILKVIAFSKNEVTHKEAFIDIENGIGKDFAWFDGGNATFEFNPKGVNKWSGVTRLADLLKINYDDILTFGDGRNDIPMLAGAKYGVAMGQSSIDVKESAKYVTDDLDSDGILNFVNKFYNNELN